MKPRAATRDAARVLGVDYATGDRLAKLIPEPIMGRTPSFEECLAQGTDLRKAYDTEPQAQQVIDVARGLEGIVRNNSIHAAAVVIADRPLTEIVPLQLAEDRAAPGEVPVETARAGHGNGGKPERVYKTVTQYSMKPIEEIGLLKMDFLGLRTLDVLENAVAIIERSGGERIDLANLPLDDRKTYEMLARGDSVGVFQLESEGMQEALREVGPTEFDDIVALVALYRPGPMRFIKDYARGKRDPATVRYVDERLRPITEPTYGIAVYQEQLMQIARDIAGFPGPKADTLRRAIGKKQRDLMATLKQDFVEGCRERRDQHAGREPALGPDGGRRRLQLQQVPCGLLRPDRVPHRLPEGELSGRVHGRADLERDVDEGQGAVLRRRAATRWTSACCRRT